MSLSHHVTSTFVDFLVLHNLLWCIAFTYQRNLCRASINFFWIRKRWANPATSWWQSVLQFCFRERTLLVEWQERHLACNKPVLSLVSRLSTWRYPYVWRSCWWTSLCLMFYNRYRTFFITPVCWICYSGIDVNSGIVTCILKIFISREWIYLVAKKTENNKLTNLIININSPHIHHDEVGNTWNYTDQTIFSYRIQYYTTTSI